MLLHALPLMANSFIAPVSDRLFLSQLSPGNVQSEIRAMSLACSLQGGINMAQGVCDTDVPAPVAEAARQAIEDGHNIYTRLDGITVLREAIADKCASYNKFSVDPSTQVLVTSGATGALHAALMALLNPGDACIVFEPFYGYHVSTLQSLRVQPVVLHTLDELKNVSADTLRRVRALILNTPSNPSGKVYSEQELETVAAFAMQHDLFVLTDEIYEYFVYAGAQHRSIAALPGMAARTITISGFSKTFSVTGWRLGYLTADPRWIPSISYFHDLTYVCAPAPLQHGAAAGLLQLPQSFYTELAADYEAKRTTICDALLAAGMTPAVPEGAYYVLADVSRVPGEDAKAKARRLLQDTGVAAVAGSAFFATDERGLNRGDHLLRFCYAKKSQDLAEACRRLRQYAAV